MGIQVRATDKGYYGHFRDPGDEFEIVDEQAFHKSWMEKATTKRGKPAPPSDLNTTGNNPAAGSKLPDLESDLV